VQRIGIVIPFSNLAVEEEFKKYVQNPDLVYQIFKLDYSTHKSDDEDIFFGELAKSLKTLIEKLTFIEFNKIIMMCSSLNAIENKFNAVNSNVILKDFLVRKQAKDIFFISPYSHKVTDKISEALEINPVVQYVDLKHSIDYYQFGKRHLRNIAGQITNSILISCTNILTMDLIHIDKCNIISTNQAIIEYLNNLKQEEQQI
jgi:maleate cis-trans isomerase